MPTFKAKIYTKPGSMSNVEATVEAKNASDAKKLFELQYGKGVLKGFSPRKV